MKKEIAVEIFWFGFAMVFGNVLALNIINMHVFWGELWAWLLIIVGAIMMLIVAIINKKAIFGLLSVVLVAGGLYLSVTSGFKNARPVAVSNGYYIAPGSLVIPKNYSSTSKSITDYVGNTVNLYRKVNEQRARNIPLFALGAALISAGGVLVTFGVKEKDKKTK